MIHLQRSIDVHSFNLEATVAVATERPEYLAVVQLAVDLQRPLDARIVHRELFGALPDTVGRLVLDRCVLLGLFEREDRGKPAHLSEAGRAALERGDVLIAEEGLWRLYYLDDPLLGRRLIHAMPLREEGTAQNVRDELKQKRRQVRSTGASTPTLVREACGEGLTWLSLIEGHAFEVHECADRGEEGPDDALRLHLQWPEDQAMQLALRGKVHLGDKQTAAVDQHVDVPEHVEEMTYDELWRVLVSFATNIPLDEMTTWRTHTGKRVLPQPFAGLPDTTLRTMRRVVDIPAHQHPALGTFEASKLDAVAVVPRGEGDAQQWAEWLEWDAVSAYAVPAALKDKSAEIAARFPYHRPKLRTPDALLKFAAAHPTDSKSRYLLAPADLGLW